MRVVLKFVMMVFGGLLTVICGLMKMQKLSAVNLDIFHIVGFIVFTYSCYIYILIYLVGIPRRNGYYGTGTTSQPVSLYFVRCRGNEKTLLDCPFSFPPIGVTHSSDAGVYCYTDYGKHNNISHITHIKVN